MAIRAEVTPLRLFHEASPALGPLWQDILAPQEEGDGPQGELGGQEGGNYQPEQLDKQGQVILTADHQAALWGTGWC